MKQRTKVLWVGAGVLALAGALLLSRAGPDDAAALASGPHPPSAPPPDAAPPAAPAPTPVVTGGAPSPSAGEPRARDAELEALAASLREKYGAKLGEPYIQIRLLEELMRYFQQRSPDRWREELLAFLRQAFPERYDALEAMLRNRVDYEKWVRDNDAYLRGLDETQRRAATWDARNRLFGKEAAERLWAGELRNQAMADTLRSLDASDGTLEQKLSTYKQRLQEIHGGNADAYLARHQQEAMNRFLELDSIQAELGGMAPEERSRNLRAVRREMGLDEEALKRWDALDQRRDARWDAGARYMAERQALRQELAGEALEAKLAELRTRYFGDEAETIAHEEASGFLRFERPRQWGRN